MYEHCTECGHQYGEYIYKNLRKVKAKDLKAGDEVQLRKGEYEGSYIGKVVVSPKGKILVYRCSLWGSYEHLIFGEGLQPDQNVVVIERGEPPAENGFYDI